jgi:hypothetical protein
MRNAAVDWIPAFAGMTNQKAGNSGITLHVIPVKTGI